MKHVLLMREHFDCAGYWFATDWAAAGVADEDGGTGCAKSLMAARNQDNLPVLFTLKTNDA